MDTLRNTFDNPGEELPELMTKRRVRRWLELRGWRKISEGRRGQSTWTHPYAPLIVIRRSYSTAWAGSTLRAIADFDGVTLLDAATTLMGLTDD